MAQVRAQPVVLIHQRLAPRRLGRVPRRRNIHVDLLEPLLRQLPAPNRIAGPSPQSTQASSIITMDRQSRVTRVDVSPVASVHEEPGQFEPVVERPLPLRLEERNPALPASKQKVYFRGLKQQLESNRLPDPEVERLPLFIEEPCRCRLGVEPPQVFPCHRRKLLRWFNTDADLVYALKMEAAFQPRTTSLLLQLKQKARKFLAGWDMSAYSSQQQYEMAMKAIGQAMLISTEEMKIQALMHIGQERKVHRPNHTGFFRDGRTGSGAGTSLGRPRVKVSALRKWVLRPLTHAIRF